MSDCGVGDEEFVKEGKGERIRQQGKVCERRRRRSDGIKEIRIIRG